MADRPITDPLRHFERLTQSRWRLHHLADRYPSKNDDWRAFQEAGDALDRAAIHFGLKADWWWRAGSHGGKISPDTPEIYRGPGGTDERW